jgi:hypothetical protein
MTEPIEWPRKTRELRNHHFDSTVSNELTFRDDDTVIATYAKAGPIRRIAEFLDIAINEARWEAILEHCSFDWMKKNATKIVPLGGAFWDTGAECARWLQTGEGLARALAEARG